MYGLSVLMHGALEEKLEWTFSLYDINGDGRISKDELTNIITSIYSMMGRYTEPEIIATTPQEHAEFIFQV